jgi:hypothetical protein
MKLARFVNTALLRMTGYRIARGSSAAPYSRSDLGRILRSQWREEHWGVWSDATISKYTSLAADLDGDFAEVGVAKGATFHRLARIASEQGKAAHAIDSFVGMAPPGEHDRKGKEPGAHLEGKFSVGGAEGFAELMTQRGLPRESYQLWEGFIPQVFASIPADTRFSMVILDVDHYQPTRESLQWLWPRLVSGGYLLLDDCSFSTMDRESTRAIKEFLSSANGFWITDYYNNQLVLRKLAEPGDGADG